MEDVRIKLSALWVARMLTGLQGDVLRFMEPGMLEEMTAGGVDGMALTEGLLLAAGTLMLIPILMVFLTLTLPRRACRSANIILGCFFFPFDAVGLPSYGSASGVLLIAAGMVFNVLTVWYAWRWRGPEGVGGAVS
jgi:hypothetical protein